MRKLRLLDLFSGAGGCSMGYHRAGFDEIVGVDCVMQPRYPFHFVQSDALEYVYAHGHEFDAIHASPPCQAYSDLKTLSDSSYPALIAETRAALQTAGKPYVIENVDSARREMIEPILLCGQMFGLKVFRHRLFESSEMLFAPPHPKHDGSTGTHRWPYAPTNGYLQITGNGGNYKLDEGRAAMGIAWMNKAELSQAIPPAFTEFIGRQISAALRQDAAHVAA